MCEEEWCRKERNYTVCDFGLELAYHAVYGEGTVMLCFNLQPHLDSVPGIYGQALVVCT